FRTSYFEFGFQNDADLRLQVRCLWAHLRRAPVVLGAALNEVPEVQEEQTGAPLWWRRRDHLQGRRFLRNRLSPRRPERQRQGRRRHRRGRQNRKESRDSSNFFGGEYPREVRSEK